MAVVEMKQMAEAYFVSVRTRESGPGQRKSWVELHRPLIKAHGAFSESSGGRASVRASKAKPRKYVL